MTSKDLIDAQFDRAVEIVQSLPKTGPIQTDYEEKLTMYSLYKQATTGNVKTPRPGIWDMLGRAKWDAWAKHRDLDPYEAKWLYVDALLKVLRKYSDKTVAMTLVEELESYGGDPSHIVSSQTFTRSSPGSDSSESTASDEEAPQYSHASFSQHTSLRPQDPHSDGEDEEEQHGPSELPIIQTNDTGSQSNRPPSSMSSRRYRTPMAGSLAMSPPPSHHSFPLSQPMPTFETPSAFAETSPVSTPALHSHTPYAQQFSDSSRAGMATPTHMQRTGYRPPSRPLQDYPGRPASVLTLERAIENVQIHLAALTERLDSLEASTYSSRSQTPRHTGSPRGRRSPTDPDRPEWDLNDLGMWSILLNPLSRGLRKLQNMSQFFAHSEHRSPTAIVVRRLCLDMSFVVFVVAFLRLLWRRSGVRRREVKRALVVLWRAVIGAGPDRLLDH